MSKKVGRGKNWHKPEKKGGKPPKPPKPPKIEIEPPEEPKENLLKKFTNPFNRFFKILLAVFAFFGIGVCTMYDRWFAPKKNDIVIQPAKDTLSQQELFAKEKFIKGILLPPTLLESNDFLSIELGSNIHLFQVSELRQGVDYHADIIDCGITPEQSERLFELKFKILDKRLYVYAIFRYIENEQVVGEVNYQNWQMIKANTFKVNQSNESLEVFDMSGYVVFSLRYQQPNIVSVKGYYVSPSCIRVIGKNIRPFDRKKDGSFNRQAVLSAITEIPRINK